MSNGIKQFGQDLICRVAAYLNKTFQRKLGDRVAAKLSVDAVFKRIVLLEFREPSSAELGR